MIILQMSGGLGNQMFQYAMYLRLRSLGREVAFDDTTQYDEEAFRGSAQKRRPRSLSVFGIQYPVASREEVIRLTDAAMDPASRIRRKLTGRKSLEKRDRDFVYDPTFLELEEGYFCGNFQSPRYLEGVEEEVRKAFTFPRDLLTPREGAGAHEKRIFEKAREQEERIQRANARFDSQRGGPESANGRTALPRWGEPAGMSSRIPCAAGGSTSIHLRFGDYLDKLEIYGGICTDAYYDAAIRHLKDQDPEMTFFIFSNDLARAGEWVRIQAERLENRGRSRFVLAGVSDEDYGYIDLYLMSLCRNHIIANSSFSWWAAFLCAAPGKTVFAPSIWNNQKDGSELARQDIYAPWMRKISPNGWEVTEHPLVSVIVTAYNVASYIERAVTSVLEQTWRNLEVVAVDDGSGDETGALLDAMARRDPRVRVIHTPNRGVSAARNEGLRHAKGAFVGFVDGDDAADPLMYEALVRGMLESGADVGVVKYQEVNPAQAAPSKEGSASFAPAALGEEPGGETGRVDRMLRESILWNRRDAILTYVHSSMNGPEERVVFHSAVWSKLFSRRTLKDNLFPEGTSAEDIPFTTKALCRARRVLYLSEPLYLYTKGREESIMSSGRAQRTLRDEIPAWQTHLALLRETGEEGLAEEAELTCFRRLLSYLEEYRRCPETKDEAKELEKLLSSDADRIRELAENPSYGRAGDRKRLQLFTWSPRAYYALTGIYEKTIVAWKRRRSA